MKLGLYVDREEYGGSNPYLYEGTKDSVKILEYESKRHREIIDLVLNENVKQLGEYYTHQMLVLEGLK